MLRSLLSPATFTLLTLTFLISPSVTPFVLVQGFRPQPNYWTCSAYAEGQGLYILGVYTKENFMLDLSVSWNTSDPVFREITNGPSVDDWGACAMTNNGKDLFVVTKGTGYVYNVELSSWKVFQNTNFAVSDGWLVAATDPETGLIYLPTLGETFTGEKVLITVDLSANTVNVAVETLEWKSNWFGLATWSAYLKGMVIMNQHYTPFMFTPSKGWGYLDLTKIGWSFNVGWSCGVAVDNGAKLFYVGRDDFGNNATASVYIIDVVKRTWTKGPPAPPSIYKSACAVTGDQLIVWGGYDHGKSSVTNNTYVFNMKTEKWVSRYIAPPPRPTTTTPASQTPTQLITNAPESGNDSSNDMKLVTIIVVVTGTLMAIILGVMFRYHRRMRQVNSCGQRTSPNGSSTDSLDVKVGDSKTSVKEHFVGSSRRRDPSDSGTDSTDHFGRRKWYTNGLLGRIHQGPFGARPLSEHPHVIVEDPTTKRNVQEGALEVPILLQHPHTVVGESSIPEYNHKTMLGPIGRYGDKEELEDE